MSHSRSFYSHIPLVGELGATPISDVQRQWLNEQGVGDAYIEGDWLNRRAPIMQAKVSMSADGLWFEPDCHGCSAFIIPEVDQFDEVIDFLAWRPKSNSLAAWVSILPLCGIGNVLRPRVDEGLLLHATFLSWLAAGRSGAFIRNVERAVPLLRDAGHLVFESEKQAKAAFECSKLKAVSIKRIRRAA